MSDGPIFDPTPATKKTLASLPVTRRGYGIHIYADKKNERFVYASGNLVIVRDIADPSNCVTFNGHRGKVNVAKFSPNGEWVASGDDKGHVYIWGVKNRQVKNDVICCRRVLDVDWSADGKRVVAAGDGNEEKAKVFPWDSGNKVGDIRGHLSLILSCSFKPSRPFRIVTSGEDNKVCRHEGPPFKFGGSFTGHTRYPNSVRYSHSGDHYVSVGSDQKINLFDGKTGDHLKTLEAKEGHTGAIMSVSWSPDDTQLLTCSLDKTARVWNVEDSSVAHVFVLGKEISDQQVGCLWAGDTLMSVSLSGAINYLDTENPSQPKRIIHGSQESVTSMEVDAKSNLVYTADADGHVTKWDLATGAGVWFTGKGHGKKINGLALSASKGTLYTIGLDDKLRANDVSSGAMSSDGVPLGGFPTALAAAKQADDTVVVATSKNTLLLIKGGSIVSTTNISYRAHSISFSSDDSEIAVGGADKKVHILSVSGTTLKEEATLDKFQGDVLTVSYSEDGKHLCAGSKDKRIYIFDKDRKDVNDYGWQYHTSNVTDVVASPSGERFVSVSGDTNAIFWNGLDSNKRVLLKSCHLGGCIAARFIDENTVITLGHDTVLRIWDWPEKQ